MKITKWKTTRIDGKKKMTRVNYATGMIEIREMTKLEKFLNKIKCILY